MAASRHERTQKDIRTSTFLFAPFCVFCGDFMSSYVSLPRHIKICPVPFVGRVWKRRGAHTVEFDPWQRAVLLTGSITVRANKATSASYGLLCTDSAVWIMASRSAAVSNGAVMCSSFRDSRRVSADRGSVRNQMPLWIRARPCAETRSRSLP